MLKDRLKFGEDCIGSVWVTLGEIGEDGTGHVGMGKDMKDGLLVMSCGHLE